MKKNILNILLILGLAFQVNAAELLMSYDNSTGKRKASTDTSAELASIITDATGTGAIVFANSPTFTGSINLGGIDDLELPNGTSITIDTDGQIGVDTSVTDWSHGILEYYSGEIMGVVAMPIAQFTSPTDGYVVAYNATNDEFELVAQSGSGSGAFDDASDPIVQNTTGKDVHFGDGAGTLTGKVEIGGDADQPQLVIEGHSTQTDSIFIVQNDADTELFSVEGDGSVTVGGTAQSTITEGLVVNNGAGGDEDDDFQVKTDTVTLIDVDAGDETMRIGDASTNYTQVSSTGAITQAGSATWTLQDGSDLIITANDNAAPFISSTQSDTMVGTLTADGLTLGANENITLGAQTLDHDGTDFVMSDGLIVNTHGVLEGDGTSGRVLRKINMAIRDGTDASTIKITTSSLFNGDAVSAVDNIVKSGTTGGYTLSSGGTQLTMTNSIITGDVVGVLVGQVVYNTSTINTAPIVVGTASTGGIQLSFRSGFVSTTEYDLTSIIDTSLAINVEILYLTDA